MRIHGRQGRLCFNAGMHPARSPVRFSPPARCPGVVAVATSAGGLRALSEMLADLPAQFPWAVVVVQHLHREYPSHLAAILCRRTALKVSEAVDGAAIEAGHVYIAAPDRHLLVNRDGTMALTDTALVHYVRPAADLLFSSVAEGYGNRVIGVVLTGNGVDGATGVESIRDHGGRVIAQDPASAEHAGMPNAAVKTGCVNTFLPLRDIGPALCALTASWMTGQ